MTFSINGFNLNSAPVNGYGTAPPFMATGSGSLISIEQTVELRTTGSGSLISIEQSVQRSESGGSLVAIEQTVAIIGSGSLISIEQTVELMATGSGSLISIEQTVNNTGAGSVISVEQIVTEPYVKPWKLVLTVGTANIPESQITQPITVTYREEDAALMDVTIRPSAGIQDFVFYQGKTVKLDALLNNGTVKRLYSGKVDIPDIDIAGETITLQCSNVRKEQLNALPQYYIDGIGSYHESVFGDIDDKADEAEKRLQTVESSLDFTPEGVALLTPWAPKTISDHTISDANIYLRNPSVSVTSRGRIVNKIDVDLNFQYQRLRQRERNFSFDSGLTACEYDAWGLPPTVEMLRTAIDGSGWVPFDLETVGLDPGGAYRCYGATIYYSPRSGSQELQVKKDGYGNVITDGDGNPQYESVNRQVTDYTNVYASSATWKGMKRFSQNIDVTNTVTVQSPQSVSQYGEVTRTAQYGEISEYEDTDFVDVESYASPPSNFTQSQNGDWVFDATNENNAQAEWSAMVQTAIKKAIVDIRKTHRDNYVSISTAFWPSIDLSHTVEATGGRIKFKGKVRQYRHYFDVSNNYAYTDAEIALSRAQGAQSDSPITVTRPTASDPSIVPATIKFGTKTIPLNGTQDPEWTGYILKELAPISSLAPIGFKTPVAMIVDTPDIDEDSRETREVVATQTNNIGIRNDLLEVEFYGKPLR